MSSLSLLGLSAYLLLALANLIVGLRLLLLARQTRELPELLIGISFLSGSATVVLALGLTGVDPEVGVGRVLVLGVIVTLVISLLTILVVVWKVFRPTEVWARVVVGLASIPILGLLFADALLREEGVHPLMWVIRLALIFPYAWAAIESYIYQRDLRRRRRFGLAPPGPMATRIALWSVASTAIALNHAWNAVVRAASEWFGVELPAFYVGALLGLVAAVSIWVAFLPPRSWRQETPSGEERA